MKALTYLGRNTYLENMQIFADARPEALEPVIEYFSTIPPQQISQRLGGFSNGCGCVGAHLAHLYDCDLGNYKDYNKGWGRLKRRLGIGRLSYVLTYFGASENGAFGCRSWPEHPLKVFTDLHKYLTERENSLEQDQHAATT